MELEYFLILFARCMTGLYDIWMWFLFERSLLFDHQQLYCDDRSNAGGVCDVFFVKQVQVSTNG